MLPNYLHVVDTFDVGSSTFTAVWILGVSRVPGKSGTRPPGWPFFQPGQPGFNPVLKSVKPGCKIGLATRFFAFFLTHFLQVFSTIFNPFLTRWKLILDHI